MFFLLVVFVGGSIFSLSVKDLNNGAEILFFVYHFFLHITMNIVKLCISLLSFFIFKRERELTL